MTLDGKCHPAYRRALTKQSTIRRVECRAPKAGDIIIRREASNPHDHHSVREFPGVAQVSYVSFEIALTVATRFARHARSDVWHEEGGRFTLIESRAAAGMA